MSAYSDHGCPYVFDELNAFYVQPPSNKKTWAYLTTPSVLTHYLHNHTANPCHPWIQLKPTIWRAHTWHWLSQIHPVVRLPMVRLRWCEKIWCHESMPLAPILNSMMKVAPLMPATSTPLLLSVDEIHTYFGTRSKFWIQMNSNLTIVGDIHPTIIHQTSAEMKTMKGSCTFGTQAIKYLHNIWVR